MESLHVRHKLQARGRLLLLAGELLKPYWLRRRCHCDRLSSQYLTPHNMPNPRTDRHAVVVRETLNGVDHGLRKSHGHGGAEARLYVGVPHLPELDFRI